MTALTNNMTAPVQVLKKTGEYITQMQRKINDHQDEIKSLKNQNSELENQIRALEKAKATGKFGNARAILESSENLVAGEDLNGLNTGEIIYDDNSSDTSDSNTGAGAVVVSKPVKTVTLPKVAGVTMTLASGGAANTVTPIQPGQSLLTSNRVQPGQSLLLSEPMRKKMKIGASNSLV